MVIIIKSWFIFILGLIFIFAIGVVYAYLQPEDLWLKLIFLVIALGWVAFMIKYIWDVMDKKRSTTDVPPTVQSQLPNENLPSTTEAEGQDVINTSEEMKSP